jgi:hypothetical protein
MAITQIQKLSQQTQSLCAVQLAKLKPGVLDV